MPKYLQDWQSAFVTQLRTNVCTFVRTCVHEMMANYLECAYVCTYIHTYVRMGTVLYMYTILLQFIVYNSVSSASPPATGACVHPQQRAIEQFAPLLLAICTH